MSIFSKIAIKKFMNLTSWWITYHYRLMKSHQSLSISPQKGFTLIELLVVIVIITALAAIAMPSVLSQSSKARQTEAKRAVSTMCRNQQIYYMENNKFATAIAQLNIGMADQTNNYKYSIIIDQPNHVMNIALAKEDNLKSYVCVTYAEMTSTDHVNSNTTTFICEAYLKEGDSINIITQDSCPEKFALMVK